jgi:hypothetical protein
MTTLPPYPWPVQPFRSQHPVRGFLCDPRIPGDGGRTFHFGIDIAAPGGTPVHAVAPGKVSYGSPADVAQNGGIVVVQANGRNFGYWHVTPAVQPGVTVKANQLIGHVSTQPEDWGHVHFAESTHGPTGISYWNPLRAGALTPFFDYGPPVIDAILTSAPPAQLSGLIDLSVKAHDNTPIAVTQPNPPGWQDMPVAPARIQWQLSQHGKVVIPWQLSVDFSSSFHPNVQGSPASDINFDAIYTPDTTQNNPNQPGNFHFWLKRGFDTSPHPDGDYELQVQAIDIRQNTRTSQLAVTFANP